MKLLKNLIIIFFLNLVYDETLLLTMFRTNAISRKNLVPKIWTNQIVVFSNQ